MQARVGEEAHIMEYLNTVIQCTFINWLLFKRPLFMAGLGTI